MTNDGHMHWYQCRGALWLVCLIWIQSFCYGVYAVCPTNTESPSGSSTNITTCVAKAGFYGAPGTAAVPCSSNNYCPAGSIAMTPCPTGTSSPSGASSVLQCTVLGQRCTSAYDCNYPGCKIGESTYGCDQVNVLIWLSTTCGNPCTEVWWPIPYNDASWYINTNVEIADQTCLSTAWGTHSCPCNPNIQCLKTERKLSNCSCDACPSNHACDGSSAIYCLDPCPSERYRAAACNITSTFCEPCTICQPENYGYVPCSENTNRVCTACTLPCALTQYETSSCTQTTNRICTSCPGSHYCNGINAFQCTVCVAGTYQTSSCNVTFNTVCTPCPPGKFCPDGTSISSCINGSTYSGTGQSVCYPCTPCSPGTYEVSSCISTLNSQCTACPAGTYNPSSNATGLASCIPCLNETFISSQGASQCQPCRSLCPLGYYESTQCTRTTNRICTPIVSQTVVYTPSCENGQSDCSHCPQAQVWDWWCNCAPGRLNFPYTFWQNTRKTDSNFDCNVCVFTYYSNEQTIICQKQYICAICPPGTYMTKACSPTEETGCTVCPPNSFCPGGSAINNCTDTCSADDTYVVSACNSTHDVVCGKCPANSFPLNNTGTVDKAWHKQCGCHANFYMGNTDLNETCLACPAYSTSPALSRGLNSCVSLDVEFQIDGVNSYLADSSIENDLRVPPNISVLSLNSLNYEIPSTLLCPVGHFCTKNLMSACPMGTFASVNGSSACSACSVGTFSPISAASACQSCPNFSTSPTQSSSLSNCTSLVVEFEMNGFNLSFEELHVLKNISSNLSVDALYQSQIRVAVVACPAGSYCVDNQQTVCPAGVYCQGGHSIDCPAGTFNGFTGASSLSNCSACTANFYCGPKSTSPQPCPTNTYSQPGSQIMHDCRCNAGFYCVYSKSLSTVISLPNVTVTAFNNDVGGIRTAFIQALAQAAGVSPSRVKIVSVKAMIQGAQRRLLEHDPMPMPMPMPMPRFSLQVHAEVYGIQRVQQPRSIPCYYCSVGGPFYSLLSKHSKQKPVVVDLQVEKWTPHYQIKVMKVRL